MNLSTLLKISRPRFWHYVLWPMLIYFASSWYFEDIQESFSRSGTDRIFNLIIMFIILWYFTLPANLWIYGWNDIADWDTDKFNSKKWSYEAKIEDTQTIKNKLKQSIWLWNIWYILIGWFIAFNLGMVADCFPWYLNEHMCAGYIEKPLEIFKSLILLLFSSYIWIILWYIVIFLLTSYLYSCRPLRAKAKPFIDGIMNVLYIATPFSIIFLEAIVSPQVTYNLQLIIYNFLAALFRCMAMHCYSAIPDIEPDRQAWLTTTAVYLGKQYALIYCGVLYILSALLSFPTLWWFSIIWWIIYISVMIISYYKKDIFALYKLFPYINLIIWFLLFRYIIFH
jgi:4-hydroxybenzoate polyprenyltransferase